MTAKSAPRVGEEATPPKREAASDTVSRPRRSKRLGGSIAKPSHAKRTEGDTLSNRDATSRDWLDHVPKALSRRLRIVILGMNPSVSSWGNRAPYANPSNRMWSTLAEVGLIPSRDYGSAEKFGTLAESHGIGFGDLAVCAENLASKVASGLADSPANDVARRMSARMKRPPVIIACVSKIVTENFLGRRISQYGFVGVGKELDLPEWFADVQIWQLPSTSGRCSISKEERTAPFRELQKAWVEANPSTSPQ